MRFSHGYFFFSLFFVASWWWFTLDTEPTWNKPEEAFYTAEKEKAFVCALNGDLDAIESFAILWQKKDVYVQVQNARREKGGGLEERYLPQSYVSAALALSLVDPQQLVALPRGLRKQGFLYSTAALESIPLDTDRWNHELLYQARPKKAFIASYSHPTTLQALRDQGCHLCLVDDIHSMEDLAARYRSMGEWTQRPVKAELMVSFIRAALEVLQEQVDTATSFPSSLFLSYSSQYLQLSTQHLPLRFLRDAGLAVLAPDEGYSYPIERETLYSLNPALIFTDSPFLQQKVLADPGLQELSAVRHKRVYALEPAAFYSSSQHALLACQRAVFFLTRKGLV